MRRPQNGCDVVFFVAAKPATLVEVLLSFFRNHLFQKRPNSPRTGLMSELLVVRVNERVGGRAQIKVGKPYLSAS